MEDGEAQQLYTEYQGLTRQLRQVQEYLEQTAQGITEISGVIEALDSLSTLKNGSKIFAPIANGIFVDASLNDAAHVRMNVGGGVVVEKDVEGAKKLLEKQRTDLEQLRDRANTDFVSLTARLRAIEKRMEQESDATSQEQGAKGDGTSSATTKEKRTRGA